MIESADGLVSMMTYVSFFSCAVLVLADYVSAVSFNYNRNDRRGMFIFLSRASVDCCIFYL